MTIHPIIFHAVVKLLNHKKTYFFDFLSIFIMLINVIVSRPWEVPIQFFFAERIKEQVTRGHNIVADGWAGASKPHPHPKAPPTLKHTQKVSKMLVFNSITMTDQRTDRRTDRRTDKASYRVACPQLKTWSFIV